MGQDFLREIRAMLLRMSLLEHNVMVEGRATRNVGGALQDPLSEGPVGSVRLGSS
jgi:hypothetical protein